MGQEAADPSGTTRPIVPKIFVIYSPIRVQTSKHIVLGFGVRVGGFVSQMGGGPRHPGATIKGPAGWWRASFEHAKRRFGS